MSRLDPHREVSRRQVGEELVLELELAVLAPGMAKVAFGVVAGAVLDAQVRWRDLHLDPPELAVLGWVLAREAEYVVGGAVLDHALERAREVVRVEEGVAAGVAGQRGQGVL